MTQRVLAILGSTGSTGASTLDVISRHPEKFRVSALAGHRQVEELTAQCAQSTPEYAVIADAEYATRLEALLKAQDSGTRVLYGMQVLIDVASADEVDGVTCAIVGAVGLPSALATVQKDEIIYPASRETLAVPGVLFMRTVRTSNARILPVDSKHNAIFQVLPHNCTDHLNGHGIRSIILAAFGGPLFNADLAGFRHITPTQAVKHPDWSTSREIPVDSATVMNKGSELIETRWLFNYPPDSLEVVTHPQSVVHGMVRYLDDSVLTQLGDPDMHAPIAYCLELPERTELGVGALNLDTLSVLAFRRPDFRRLPYLRLTYSAMYAGGSIPCVLNTTNEIAVAAFLNGKIRFIDIAHVAAHCLDAGFSGGPNDAESLLALDAQTRVRAQEYAESLDQ